MRDFCGRVVGLESFAPHRRWFESQGLLLLSCEEAIKLAYGPSVVLIRYPLVPEIMHEEAPDVFLHHLKLGSHNMTLTVFMRHKNQQNSKVYA